MDWWYGYRFFHPEIQSPPICQMQNRLSILPGLFLLPAGSSFLPTLSHMFHLDNPFRTSPELHFLYLPLDKNWFHTQYPVLPSESHSSIPPAAAMWVFHKDLSVKPLLPVQMFWISFERSRCRLLPGSPQQLPERISTDIVFSSCFRPPVCLIFHRFYHRLQLFQADSDLQTLPRWS